MNPLALNAADDYDLMQAIASDDRAALELFYDRYSGLVYTLCFRALGDREEAEDVMIDVFWEIWEKSDRYDPARSAPRTYLLMLARSRAIDRTRSEKSRAQRKNQPLSAIEESDVVEDDSVPQPGEAAEERERREHVIGVMEKLNENEREAIELSFFEGLSHSQIADRLESPLGTVKTRIRQGLQKLRQSLSKFYSDRDES